MQNPLVPLPNCSLRIHDSPSPRSNMILLIRIDTYSCVDKTKTRWNEMNPPRPHALPAASYLPRAFLFMLHASLHLLKWPKNRPRILRGLPTVSSICSSDRCLFYPNFTHGHGAPATRSTLVMRTHTEVIRDTVFYGRIEVAARIGYQR